MGVVTIEQIAACEGQEVTLQGWLYNLRESGKLLFPQFRDGTGVVQGVVSKKEHPEAFAALADLTQESSLEVTGMVHADPRAPGGYELQVTGVAVLQRIAESDPYPIQLKQHGTDFLLENRHLWIRTPRQAAILRLRDEAIYAARLFMHEQGYVLTDAPIFTPSSCEGTTNLFEVDYMDDQKAYLSQSGQLYVEATAAALGKVYCFGPAFRAERSKTRRHLTEFWILEPEAAFAHVDDMMALAEGLITHIIQSCLEHCRKQLETLGRDASKLESVRPPFPRVSYDEAIEILHRNGNSTGWGEDFGGDEETLLSSQFDRPLIVHRFPAAIKPFYMEPDPDRPEVALGFDILAAEGYGEIVGGGERVSSYDLLRKRLRENNLPEEPFRWYLDLRRYGSVPHAGFGLGIERTIAWIAGVEHVREVIPFPRTIYRLYP
ncbi:MAG TPA: asparagine--tRNA ligase [Candidatus Dormibacteraeota bacterium]|nr:asparagine--tRNA ligase [Candidatus Dormibacteraeota bacterium]